MSLPELRQVNFIDWQNATSDAPQMVLSRLNVIEASPVHSVNVLSKPLSKLENVRLRHLGPHTPSVGPVHDLLNTADETYLSLSSIQQPKNRGCKIGNLFDRFSQTEHDQLVKQPFMLESISLEYGDVNGRSA